MNKELIKKYQKLYDKDFGSHLVEDPFAMHNYIQDTVLKDFDWTYDAYTYQKILRINVEQVKLLRDVIKDHVIWESGNEEWTGVVEFIDMVYTNGARGRLMSDI